MSSTCMYQVSVIVININSKILCLCLLQAFKLLCDLLLLYSAASARSTPALAPLVHLPSDSLRSEMAGFIVDYVFCDTVDTEHNGHC